jgi:hypothetical protein
MPNGTAKRNDLFPQTILAFLVHKIQPHTFCRCLDRAGPSYHTRVARLADGALGAGRGKNPVPKHWEERGEQPELHPHTPNSGATASTRAISRQDA